MSWPIEDTVPGVASVNWTSAYFVISFVKLVHLQLAAAIFVIAGVPVKVFYADLSSAYKRSGQQNMSMWQRSFMAAQGAQSLERICFGQADGPSSFSRQSGFIRYIAHKEMQYANECHPPSDPAVLAFIAVRKMLAPPGEETAWSALFFLMVFIDDFAGISIDDPLTRLDGSVVRDTLGMSKHRSTLLFEVLISVITRSGHACGDDKVARPAFSLVVLGAMIDISKEVISLDPFKRIEYRKVLASFILNEGGSRQQLQSLAFKMLVVCECDPRCRQWLHPLFRRLRSFNHSGVEKWGVEVVRSLERFESRLDDGLPIEVPLACALSFPLAGEKKVLVKFDDASGDDTRGGTIVPSSPLSPPGWGSCTVRGDELWYMWGTWTKQELAKYHITILEAVTTVMSTPAFLDFQLDREKSGEVSPAISHVLEFSDNSGCEWSMRRETPYAEALQRLAAIRQEELLSRRVFAKMLRVTSTGNRWADSLSRGSWKEVIAEAMTLGLKPVRVYPSDKWRNVASWM